MGLLADAAGVRLASNVPPVCLVNGVPDALRRILINLIDNAVKYTQRGGTVTVTLRSHDAPAGSAVVVEVQDTGSGISAEDLPYIFDRFYRTGADRSRSTGGGGLGLSIAQSLAALHGGEIEVASVVGWGSVFRLRLGPGSGHPTPASPGFQNPGPQSDRS
jgi:two-component system sensor histidine kinase BaeS